MMKRKIAIFIISLFFIYNIAFSEEEICFSCNGKKSEIHKEQFHENHKNDNCCPSLNFQTLRSANICRKNTNGVYLNISALLWQSKEGNLEYAAKDKKEENIANTDKVEVIIPDFGWRPGVKVDLGYIFDYDNWDNRALWTYYRGEFTHVKKHSNAELYPEGNGIIPFYFYNFFEDKISPSPRYEHSTGDWMMHFNSIDIELARNFFIRRKLSLRLFFGAKGAWINQDYRVYYNDGNTVSGASDNIRLIKTYIHFKNNSWGIGPRIGFESKCHLIWGFKFLANTSFSTLATHFDVKRDEDNNIYDNIASENKTLKIKLKENFNQLKPNIQLLLGILWSKCFCKSSFGISTSYEMQYFFGQNQIKRFIDDSNVATQYSNKGDLQLHGLTATLNFEF